MSILSHTLDPSLPKPMHKPNFFLLGAGRSGTTSLHEILIQHPEVYMPKVMKEPSFFCSYFQVIRNPIDYFSLFNEVDRESAIGEASHVYLSNPETAPALQLVFPEAKFLLILRNPTNRAFSLFQWAHRSRCEPLETFEEAVNAERDRYEDFEFFRSCGAYFWNFMYVRSSYYHIQWRRYLRFFPRDRFFVMSLQELSDDPVRCSQEIFRFLEVDDSFVPECSVANAIPGIDMHPQTRAELDEHFAVTVEETEKIAGRSLQLDKL